MKILVTGASGFIGRHTVPNLLKNGYEVHAIFHSHKPEFKAHKKLIWHKCSILNPLMQEKLCAEVKADQLLHFAWYTEPGKYWVSLENLRWVQASLGLIMNFVKNGGTRAVIAGTCAEYGWEYGYCSEKVTPLIPTTLYGACKNSLAAIVKHFSAETGLSYAWGRIFCVYGPYENPQRLVPSVIRSLQKNKIAQCTHGNQVRDFLYVEDVASAFVKLLMSNINGPVNIASDCPVRLQEVVLTAADCFGLRKKVQFGVLPVPDDEPPLIVGDNRRLSEEVGWSPAYDLASGIAQTVRYWQKGKNETNCKY